MSSPAVTCPSSATVGDVARVMVEHRIGSVVLVDTEHPELVAGIVTMTDLELRDERVPFAHPTERAPRLLGMWVQSREGLEAALEEVSARRASEVMSTPVWTVAADADIWDAAQTMVDHDVKRLPVIDRGRLVGIVARHDFLKAMIRLDRERE